MLIELTENLVKETIERRQPETRTKMSLVKASDLCQGGKTGQELLDDIFKPVLHPGPHVLLYVHQMNPYSETDDITTSLDEDRIKIFKEMFGNDSVRYFLPLVTYENGELSDENKKKLLTFFKEFGFESEKICVLDVTDDDDDVSKKDQVNELVEQIEVVKSKNKGTCYTVNMFKQAQEALVKEVGKPKDQGSAESKLHSATRAVLTPVLGPELAELILKVNACLAQKSSECI